MDFDILIRVLGVAVSIAVPALVHLLSHPRKRVSYVLDERPAAPGVVGPDGSALNLVTVRLWASGRTDISSTEFDGQKPIVFQFNHAIVDAAAPPDESHIEGWGFERAGANQVVLAPSLLARRTVFTTTVAMPAPVHYWVKHPLINIPMILEATGPSEKGARRSGPRIRITALSAGITMTVLGVVGGSVVSPLLFNSNPTASTTVFLIAGSFQTIGLVMIVVSVISRIVRSRARRRASLGVSVDPQNSAG